MPAMGCRDRREAGPAEVTFGWIRNTLELDRLAISQNLRLEIRSQPRVEVEAEIELGWDRQGNLVSPFSVRAGAGHV